MIERMAVAEKVVDYAGSLFDVVGCTRVSDTDSLLILGLETTPRRNLDEFGRRDDAFWMYGFREHIGSRLDLLISFLHAEGYSAEPVGRFGYPQRGKLNLKEAAVRAGLGKPGKSTVLLHPRYGPWLRLAALRTDAPLKSLMGSEPAGEENPVCSGCTICIDVCPVTVLEPYRMPDTSPCLSNVDVMVEDRGRLVLCDKCLLLCPAGRVR